MKADERKDDGAFFDSDEVASFTECTGLMPALPRTETENEECASLYGIHRAKVPGGKLYRAK